ncbi:MAG: MFS transporter [Anaerolineae bacterium]
MFNRSTSNRLLTTLFVAQSMFSASQIAIATLIAIVAAKLAGAESVAGMPTTTMTFSQALMAVPIALLMGRFGRRIGLTLGYGLGALGGLLGLAAIMDGQFVLLLFSAALLGMSRASTEQGRFAAGEIFPETERARMIGRLVFAGTIGAVVGPVLVSPSGRLLESLGQSADMGPWAVALFFNILAALLIFLLLRPDPSLIARQIVVQTADVDAPKQTARPLVTLLMQPRVQLAIIAALVSQSVMVILMVMTPLYMDHNHHGRDTISLVISMHTLGMYGLSAVTGYLIDRFGRIPMLFAGAGIIILSALLSPVSTNEYVLAVALFLLGLGWNFGYVSSSSLLADTLRGAERARVQGINDLLVFLAAGFGSLGAGPLFEKGGYAAISGAVIVLALALIGMIFWLGRPRPEVATIAA